MSKNLKMNELVEQYHGYYRVKVSRSTFESDKYVLYEFIRWLDAAGVTSPGDVNEELMRRWLKSLEKEKGNGVRTRRKKIKAVQNFYTWLVGEGYVLSAPLSNDFYRPHLEYMPRPVPAQAAAMAVLRSSGNHDTNAVRNRAIIELCYSSGLRRSEIRSLNVRDVRGNEVRVIGKGGKERVVPFGRQARKWLDKYIHGERRAVTRRHNPLEEALFIGITGKRLCPGAYNVILKKQVKSPYGLHSFRHACASHMLENGAGIRDIQKLLGHERLSTTQKYTHVRVEHLERMLEKCHPRG